MAGRRRDLVVGATLCSLLGLLYWHGRCPSFDGADSPQHVLSSITWGVSWPPGYPLYVLLGHLASLLPGSPSGNVNGLSGVLHGLAAAVLFLTLRRLQLKTLPALISSLLMALSPIYWYYSEIAEVRALNDLLAVCAACAAVVWTQGRSPKALLALAAFLGFGISHHPTFVLLLPAIGYWLWANRSWPRGGQCVWAGAVLLSCCALPYLILGLRLQFGTPAYNLTSATSLRDMPRLFLRRDLGGPLRVVAGRGLGDFDPARLRQHLWWFLRSAWSSLFALGSPLAFIGLVVGWRERRRESVFWGLWFGVTALAYIVPASQQMRLHDQDFAYAIAARFHLLPLIALFPLAGYGADWLLRRLSRGWAWGLLAAAAALPLALRPVSMRGRGFVMDYARQIVRDSGPSDLVILNSDGAAFAMLYLELVEHAADDRVLLVPALFSYPPYRSWLARRHSGLVLPPEELMRDWTQWLRLNPSRGLLADAESEPDLRMSFPDGILRVLPANRALRRQDLYPFSPDVELLRADRLILVAGSRLPAR